MAPLTSSQLLVLSVPAIAVLLNYLWFKKKRIGAQSDPGDKETDRTDSSVETGKKSSVPLDIGPKTAQKDSKESSSAPQQPKSSPETPNKTFSRSFSAPIPIILPEERRLNNNFRISDEELDLQIEKVKPSGKITNPFDKIKSKNSSNSVSPFNGLKSLSPKNKITLGSRTPTSIPNQEVIKSLREEILKEIDPEITIVPIQETSGKTLPDPEDHCETVPIVAESATAGIVSEKENQTEIAIEEESQELVVSVDKNDTIVVENVCENNNNNVEKIEEITVSEEMTSTENTEISEESTPISTEAAAKMCNSGKTKEETSPAPVTENNTDIHPKAQNKAEEEKCIVEDRPSSEEGSCSIEDRHSSADERPSSAEPATGASTGAIPKKNKKKKFRKLECDLKDLGKKLRETKADDKKTPASNNKKSGQKSRSDSGCEREEANAAHSSGRQSANESPSDAMMMAVSSSLTSLNESEGSNDSGKGCSEVVTPPPQVNTTVEEVEEENVPTYYEFLIHKNLVGKLIGKKGAFVNSVYTKTNAHLVVKDHPFDVDEKVCIVEGTKEAIAKAMKMVKQRFPKEKFKQFVPEDCVPPSLGYETVVSLPGGLNVETYVSFIIAPNHLYIQQPSHLSYPNYIFLHNHLNTTYGNEDVPLVPAPVKESILCVAFAHNCWTRAWVMSADQETQMAYVKSLDIGGYANVPFSSLKQMRHDLLSLPFQATECLLFNIEPAEDEWPEEALTLMKTLTTNRLVYTHVVSYTDDNIPLVNCQVFIDTKLIWLNCELVKRGFAKWSNQRSQAEASYEEQ